MTLQLWRRPFADDTFYARRGDDTVTMANVQDQLQQALGTAYVLERELGGGGMSRVFVADEAALGRQVVVKVLGVELAEGISAERFKREVRLAARLQHPHIVPLLAAGALTDGLLYYTMPFVDGESLRARLAREGGFPIADAVRIGRDVASALAYAHRAGVVHRDIKPENILLADGGAVVVDFGIAKAIHESRGADDAPDSRRSSTLTRVGTSLGTPAYMAPEQAAGDAIDQRADLYALGVVVYEMIAGRALFERRTAQQTLAAHATEAPEPIARHRSALPPSLGALIMQLLEKNPADRPQSADEVLRGLDDAMRAHPESHSPLHAQAGAALSGATYESGGHTDSPGRPVRRSRVGLLMFVGTVAALAGAAAGALIVRSRSSAPRLLAAAITAPDGAVLKPGAGFALSPEGGRLAFVAADSVGAQAIWVQPLDGQLPAPVSGTENGTGPFWSPDGASLGFFAGGRLKIVELRGGSPRVLCAALRAGGGTWTKDGVIVYAPNIIVGSPLFRVASAGGPCTQLTRLRPSDGDHRRPSALPDGRRVLFSAFRAKVALAADVVTGAITEVRRPGGDAQFAAPDWLLFRDEERGVLYAQRLDLRTLRPVGESRVVLDRLGNPSLLFPGFTVSAGALATPRGGPGNRKLIWVNRQSAVSDSVILPVGAGVLFGFLNIGMSRDGRRLALGGPGLWLHERTRGVATRVLIDSMAGMIGDPAWSPGDSLIAYTTLIGPLMLRVYHVGSGTTDSLFSLGGRTVTAPDWSPDGRRIAFQLAAGDGAAKDEIWLYSFSEHRAWRVWESAGNLASPRWSPDGRWLAYVSDETGVPEVYVRPADGHGVGVRVSVSGGLRPRWRSDGRELFFLAPDGAILGVKFTSGARITLSTPHLAAAGISFSQNARGFEVAPDGEWFVAIAHADPPVFRLLLDWAAKMEKH